MTRLNVLLRCAAIALALFVTVANCGFKTNYEDSKRTEEAIKNELGAEAHIKFQTFASTANGTHTLVTVSLREPPSGDIHELKVKVTKIVEKTFRSKIDRVNIVF